MKHIEYNFFPWVIFNEVGDDVGISNNAPDEAKKAYADFHRDEGKDGVHII